MALPSSPHGPADVSFAIDLEEIVLLKPRRGCFAPSRETNPFSGMTRDDIAQKHRRGSVFDQHTGSRAVRPVAPDDVLDETRPRRCAAS